MLVNWLKRDVKIVGVRPLSETFFKTYPEDLQKERILFKPGLMPPFYADMPARDRGRSGSRSDAISHRYKKHPWRTDIIYLFQGVQ